MSTTGARASTAEMEAEVPQENPFTSLNPPRRNTRVLTEEQLDAVYKEVDDAV